MTQCYRRFKHPVYLLTCDLEKGHKGQHKDGEYTWAPEEGFDDEYTGAPVKYDPHRVRPEPEYTPPEVETLEESAKRAPKFYSGTVVVTADKDSYFRKGALDAIPVANKTVAERLAERRAINAALNKTTK